MTALTPEQEARVREIAALTVAQVLAEADRLRGQAKADEYDTAARWVIHNGGSDD